MEAEYIYSSGRSSKGCSLDKAIAQESSNQYTGRASDNPDRQCSSRSTHQHPSLQYLRRRRHIDHRYHYIRQEIRQGRVSMKKIREKDNLADHLTKIIGSPGTAERMDVENWGVDDKK